MNECTYSHLPVKWCGVLAAALMLLPTLDAPAAVTRNWNALSGMWTDVGGTGNSWSPAGVPGEGDTANIVFGDLTSRTVTYDFLGAVTLAALNIDQNGILFNQSTLAMPAHNLTSNSEFVGVNGRGTFNHSGGTNTLAVGAGFNFLDVGVFAGSSGAYNLSGTGALVANTSEYMGDLGNGTFTQTGGSNTILGGASQLYLGYNTNTTGTYALSAGSLSINTGNGNEYIGYNGTGTFNQSGGTNVADNLVVASQTGSHGTYNLSGPGALTVNLNELVGPTGTGSFVQTGGTHTITRNLSVYTTGGTYTLSGGTTTVGIDASISANGGSAGVFTVGGTGVLNVAGTLLLGGGKFYLSGGTVNTAELNFGGVPGRFNWAGGTLNMTHSTTWDSAASLSSTSAAFGSALALGSNRTLSVTGNETLGGTGGFDLTISAGGTHTVTGTTTISPAGSITVDGGTFNTGTLVKSGGLVFKHGTLNLTNQASFIGPGGFLGSALDLASDMSFSAALGISNQGLVTGDGQIGGPFANTAFGELRAEPGRSLTLTGIANSNQGHVNLYGGQIEFTQDLTNNASGFISGNGTLIARGGLTNQGTMNFSGAANIVGNVTNAPAAKVISSGGGPTTFFNDVINNGEIRTSPGGFTVFFGSVSGGGTFTGTGTVNFEGDLSPGNSPALVNFAGNVALGPAAALKIELGGTTAGSQYDEVNVAGNLSLDGTLDVSLINGFTPQANASFNILDWGSRSGTFAALDLPSLASNLMWNASQLNSAGVLRVFLAGDYNGDGTVNAADYTVWRNSLGQSGTGLAADGNHDMHIDRNDFDVWKAHFGQSGPGGGASDAANVPEPATLGALFLAILAVCARRSDR